MKNIGKIIHVIDVKLKRKIDRLADEYNLTLIQFIAMERIYLSSKEGDVYQRDLEMALDVRRSTVSNVLGILENKGYLLRESVPCDARLKKLVLTAEGESVYREFKQRLEQDEAKDFQVFTDEEAETLMRLLKRLSETIK
ncbi:MarR family transcriptional regulator [Anaerovorax odorimutans]|uniref:MarR family transcriptional regulator n=1 Tax=Anaerovorax odorimutans TaxID=109327 RepID=A0ABT1RKS7_9FIRM|nr:MarR family transcriptional regulator [Anaerovorax odorimutans]MCQ4635561.1 MarR family transcriptional regulator [Anaerovorax odorimutans]